METKKPIFYRFWKCFLGLVFLFLVLHTLKDITQDILKVATPLDLMGNVEEDFSGHSILIKYGYYFLMTVAYIAGLFLLITIPKTIIRNNHFKKIDFFVAGSVLYIGIFCLIALYFNKSG